MPATGNGALMRRRTVLAAAIAAVGLASLAQAHADAAPVDLVVVDRDTGQPLRIWPHDGRLFVAGRPGARYGLRVTNRTDGRVLVVMSVDGVNILTGETAGYDQRGYILGPHQSYDLNGWRKSRSEVADFTFARLPQSYAALTGRPENVGVIGIAVFNEKAEAVAAEQTPPAPFQNDFDRGSASRAKSAPYALREAPSPSPSLAAGANPVERDEKLGTGHGAREYSAVTIEPFERASPYPQFTQEIEYDTHDNLVAMGVIPAWRYGERRPTPFPSTPEGGFVPDPPLDP